MIGSTYANATSAPFYIGTSLGYGSTDWDMLVTQKDSPASLSSPIGADDDGFVWGFLMGYYLCSNFALETDYMHFAKATITFENPNVYWPDQFTGTTTITSNTSAVNLMGKFIIPSYLLTQLNLFANAGLALIIRNDVLAKKTHPGGIFGVGAIYTFAHHIMSQIAFQFYTGYGRSEVKPAVDYIPFLWQIHFVLAYRFNV